MKIVIIILGLLNSCFMLIDGIFVMINGKYIGPEKPGPWANIFYKLEIDVFKLGPMFIIYGLIWSIFLISFLTNQSWSNIFGMIISILTLWYLPFGTLISIVVFILLLILKK